MAMIRLLEVSCSMADMWVIPLIFYTLHFQDKIQLCPGTRVNNIRYKRSHVKWTDNCPASPHYSEEKQQSSK